MASGDQRFLVYRDNSQRRESAVAFIHQPYRQTAPTSEGSLTSIYTSPGSTVAVGQFWSCGFDIRVASAAYDFDARYITYTFDRHVRVGSGGTVLLKNTDTNQTGDNPIQHDRISE